MFDRLRIILAHPTRIGLFFKDKIYIPILFVLTMFFLFVSVDSIYNVNTKQFNYSQAKAFNTLVQNTLNEKKEVPSLNMSFDSSTDKITGDNHVFIGENIVLAVNSPNTYSRNGYICVNLRENGADLYEGFVKIGYVEYKTIEATSFTFSNVQSGTLADNLHFTEFIYKLFSNINTNQAILHVLDNSMTCFIFFIGVLIFCLIDSYFLNPPIEMKVRIRLVIYDAFPYLFVMLLSALFRASWLQYVALAIPIIYVNLTFSHIKKIR